MAVAYNIVRKAALQNRVTVDITLDAAYPAGGYALTNNSMGVLSTPDAIDFDVKTAQGFTPCWDVANNKLKMFKSGSSSAHTECASADLSSAVVVRADVSANPLSGVIV